jgi:hypothetical protein
LDRWWPTKQIEGCSAPQTTHRNTPIGVTEAPDNRNCLQLSGSRLHTAHGPTSLLVSASRTKEVSLPTEYIMSPVLTCLRTPQSTQFAFQRSEYSCMAAGEGIAKHDHALLTIVNALVASREVKRRLSQCVCIS